MNKYIDTDALAKRAYEVAYPIVYDCNSHERGLSLTGLAQLLDEMSPADVRENVKGEWIEHKYAEVYDGLLQSNFECNQCRDWVRERTDFCPNCGADMRKK